MPPTCSPSGHHAQPWRVTIQRDGTWTPDSAPDRRLPAIGPHDREAAISLGAFQETLETAAPAFGLSQGEVAVENGPTIHLHVADGPMTAPSILEAIHNRRTRRRGLQNSSLPQEVVQALLVALPDLTLSPWHRVAPLLEAPPKTIQMVLRVGVVR